VRASRGMGDINPKKRPGAKQIKRKDKPQFVDVYKEGGMASIDKLAKAERKTDKMGKRKKTKENLGNLSVRAKQKE
jgi:hypothetical protein